MASVDLLYMGNNAPGEIAERAAGQLKNCERIESVVVVVVIVDREFLVFVQHLVKANLKLVPTVGRLDHILGLIVCAARARQKFHQAFCYGIKARRGHYAARKNRIVELWSARSRSVKACLTRAGKSRPAPGAILENVCHQ